MSIFNTQTLFRWHSGEWMNKPNEPGPNGHCSCDKSLKNCFVNRGTAIQSSFFIPLGAPPNILSFNWPENWTGPSFSQADVRAFSSVYTPSLWGDWGTGGTDETGERVKQVRERQSVCVCVTEIDREREGGGGKRQREGKKDNPHSMGLQAFNSVKWHNTYHYFCFFIHSHAPARRPPNTHTHTLWVTLPWMLHGASKSEQPQKGRMNVTMRGKRERERQSDMFYHFSTWLAQRQAVKHNPDILWQDAHTQKPAWPEMLTQYLV